MFKVLFIIFSKPKGKHFSGKASLFDKITQVTFTLAFFISYSRLHLYNKRTLASVSVNFEKNFEISYRTPKSNFIPYRPLLDFTTALKRVFILFH